MKYMLLIYANPSQAPEYTPEELHAASQEWHTLSAEMQAAGVFVANNGLSPVTEATSLRVRGGKTIIADGPFAETHEQLGGYFLLECQDLDEALGWAAKIPGARWGTIEVRPLYAGPR